MMCSDWIAAWVQAGQPEGWLHEGVSRGCLVLVNSIGADTLMGMGSLVFGGLLASLVALYAVRQGMAE